MGDYNLYWGFALETLSEAKNISYNQSLSELKLFAGDSEDILAQRGFQKGIEIIGEYPITYIYIHVKGVLRGLLGMPFRGVGYYSQFFNFADKFYAAYVLVVGLTMFHFIYFFVFAVLLFFGYWKLIKNMDKQIILLPIILASFYFLLIFGPMGNSRYRVFSLPMDSIIVAFSISVILEKLKKFNIFKKQLFK